MTACVACGMEPCRVAMADVDSSRWDQPVTVAYENTDTTSLYDMSVVLHVSPRFNMEHISFDIEILSPDRWHSLLSTMTPYRPTHTARMWRRHTAAAYV